MESSKQYNISKQLVMDAYEKVKANKGSAGIDDMDFERYEVNLKGNLYKLWNRMSSGSYFPKAVKAVEIPKKDGGVRRLGIPTIDDRTVQMVVKLLIEPRLEPIFHEDSYGYRPNKSAIDAVGVARQRCWKYDYVIDLDIKGLFDNIDHNLLMKAVRKHVKEKWILLYIDRWLKAPFQLPTGERLERTAGTPQGGVISPVLANLFMHYAVDLWMSRNFQCNPFERYADDMVIHCVSEHQAEFLLMNLKNRLQECKLELHPVKTKIVYCKDKDRTKEYPNIEFDFLGYTFRQVLIKDRLGRLQMNFLASVSKKSEQSLKDKIKVLEIHKRTGKPIEIIAEMINPILRGWMNYFGRFNKSAMKRALNCIQRRLIKWAICKFKNFRGRRRRAEQWLEQVRKREPKMFAHWAL